MSNYTKSNLASPTFTGTITADNLVINGTISLSIIDGGTY